MSETIKAVAKVNGHYIGLQPGTADVYADRDTAGSWEELALTKHADGKTFDVLLKAADKQLSQNLSGGLESRPKGTGGSWETFYATEQPDGSKLLYRLEQGRLLTVLQLEVLA